MVVETPRQLTKKLLNRHKALTTLETEQSWKEDEQARDRLLLEMKLIRARCDYARRYNQELADDWPLVLEVASGTPIF